MLLTRSKMAEKLGVSTRTLDRYRKQGLPCLELPGGTVRFDENEVDEYLKHEKGENENENNLKPVTN